MLKPVKLKNGLTIVRIPRNGSNQCVIGYVAKTGSVFDAGHAPQGTSHLIERLFWCGTDKHPTSKHLNLAVEGLGGKFGSLTEAELTQFYLTVPSYNQFKAISLMAEVIQRSYFEPRDVEKEKKYLADNIRRSLENVELDSEYFSMATTFPDHALGYPVVGSLDTILSIDMKYIREYLSHQYCPENSLLILAGNFDTKACTDLIEQEWNRWSPKVSEVWEYPELSADNVYQDLPRVIYKQRGVANTQLRVNFVLDHARVDENSEEPIDTENQEEHLPDQQVLDNEQALPAVTWNQKHAQLLVLNALLGEGFSSRLWSKTVDEEMLFVKIRSDIKTYLPVGILQISGMTDNSQFTFGLESILSTLEALKKVTVSINELTKAKEFVKGKLLLSHENLLEQVVWEVERYSATGQLHELSDILTLVESVDAAQIRSLATDLFVPSRLVISSLGPAKETKLVDKLIRKYLD